MTGNFWGASWVASRWQEPFHVLVSYELLLLPDSTLSNRAGSISTVGHKVPVQCWRCHYTKQIKERRKAREVRLRHRLQPGVNLPLANHLEKIGSSNSEHSRDVAESVLVRFPPVAAVGRL